MVEMQHFGPMACSTRTCLPVLSSPTPRFVMQRKRQVHHVRCAIPEESGCDRQQGVWWVQRRSILLAVTSAFTLGCDVALADVRIALSGVRATEVPCPEGQTTVTGGTSFGATCFRVTGDALNPAQQPVYNVDIFGRVYDAQGEPALDAAESLRIDTIAEIPPGKSQVSFQITVSESQARLGPLELRSFKGTGYLGKVNNRQGSGRLDDMDFTETDEDGDYVP